MKNIALGLLAFWIWAGFGQGVRAGLVIYTFSFTDGTGNPTLISPAANPNFLVSGLTVGNSAVAITPVQNSVSSSGYAGASGTFNMGNAFQIGALDVNTSAFLSFTVSNNTGLSQTLTDFDFGVRSTGTGPQGYSLRLGSSFSSEIASGTITNNSTWSFKNNSFSEVGLGAGDTEVRLYGFAGSGTVNQINGRFDDFTVTFNVAAVPEPSSMMLLGVAGAVAGVVRLRRSKFKHQREGI